MLGSGKVVKAVADFLSRQSADSPARTAARSRLPNIVLDPILKSSSGADLLDAAGIRLLIERLIPLADVVTPNVDEAAALTGLKVEDSGRHESRLRQTPRNGSPRRRDHWRAPGKSDRSAELCRTKRGIEQEVFKAERQRSNSTHGTGCAFATAMACHLALDRGLAEAALLAKTYVTAAISNGHPLGRGTGPCTISTA